MIVMTIRSISVGGLDIVAHGIRSFSRQDKNSGSDWTGRPNYYSRHADGSRVGIALISLCDSVCPHDKTKTAETRQTRHRDIPSWILGQGHRVKKSQRDSRAAPSRGVVTTLNRQRDGRHRQELSEGVSKSKQRKVTKKRPKGHGPTFLNTCKSSSGSIWHRGEYIFRCRNFEKKLLLDFCR